MRVFPLVSGFFIAAVTSNALDKQRLCFPEKRIEVRVTRALFSSRRALLIVDLKYNSQLSLSHPFFFVLPFCFAAAAFLALSLDSFIFSPPGELPMRRF